MEYNFSEVEKKWRKYWSDNHTYRVGIDHSRPKYYVLDMFPYPSGAGLHVGHPLGYIASDIFSRYKRLCGYNVLHPMGYDAYGLPAEQYAIQTGQHPAETTARNIARYREQLDLMGFTYDWSREVRTCDPAYYRWTQWTFLQLFSSWYNRKADRAEPIETLTGHLENYGTEGLDAACSGEPGVTAAEWQNMSEKEKQQLLMNYRLAYLSDTLVNWCPELGTVLANDEVREGFSIRGGHPVERKLMRQWLLRITAYTGRLLSGLDRVDWSDSLKEMQRNWIGRSEGASVLFPVKGHSIELEIFTTRPDTLFGATFMVLAPEHESVFQLTTPDRKKEVEAYVSWAKNRSERERMAEVKQVTGVFTGAFAQNPLSGEEIPVWVADYVLSGYGTGAIMAVPAHDSRDYAFAKNFGLTIREVVSGGDITVSSYDAKEGTLVNSGFIDGMDVKSAVAAVTRRLEERNIGKGTVNYRLRDAIFSRQRYWGEPFPIYYRDGMPYALPEDELPLELPEIGTYQPSRSGEAPLARAENWKTKEGFPLETNTMPGFAGSSGYYLRYMDPQNDKAYFSREAVEYWQDVDLYIGGAEHATGHLIYARFWNKFLFDRGFTIREEPFRKLVNQGMIQGRSSIVYRLKGSNEFVSFGLKDGYETIPINVDINLVDENDFLDIAAFRQWRPDYADASFILEDGKYRCGHEIEKMSKSLHNVVNPDELIAQYGADTFRLYEMFLGPLEQSKPWDTHGIEGVFRFIRKLWRLYHSKENQFFLSDGAATPEELKSLHKAIRKTAEDIERLSFNTVVSTFMICVNELSELKCNKRIILQDLIILVSPFAPHLAEELWEKAGNAPSVANAAFPVFNPAFVEENTFAYPVSFNGKMRFKLEMPVNATRDEVEQAVLSAPESARWLGPQGAKKVIVVPGKIINIVV